MDGFTIANTALHTMQWVKNDKKKENVVKDVE